MSTLHLTVSLCFDDRHAGPTIYNHGVTIGEPFTEAFRPVDVVSNPISLMFAENAALAGSVTMQRVKERRTAFAKELADSIAAEILQAMESRDLENGYGRKSTS
jgi:hypothetical protein